MKTLPRESRNSHTIKGQGMDIQFEVAENDIVRIILSGRLDIEGTKAIEETLMTKAPSADYCRVVVDLTAVSYLASVGLGCLVRTAQIVEKVHGKLVFFHPQPMVAKVLQESGVALHVRVFESWTAASAFLERLPRAGN